MSTQTAERSHLAKRRQEADRTLWWQVGNRKSDFHFIRATTRAWGAQKAQLDTLNRWPLCMPHNWPHSGN